MGWDTTPLRDRSRHRTVDPSRPSRNSSQHSMLPPLYLQLACNWSWHSNIHVLDFTHTMYTKAPDGASLSLQNTIMDCGVAQDKLVRHSPSSVDLYGERSFLTHLLRLMTLTALCRAHRTHARVGTISRPFPLRGGCVPTLDTHTRQQCSVRSTGVQPRHLICATAAPPPTEDARSRVEWKGGKSGKHDRKSSIYSAASLHPRLLSTHDLYSFTPPPF